MVDNYFINVTKPIQMQTRFITYDGVTYDNAY